MSKTNKKTLENLQGRPQKGFSMLLVIVVVAIIATLWISTTHQTIISFFKTKEIQSDFYELNQVKARLLQYAALYPELYQADGSVSAPGFLPCPDLNGDGDGAGELVCSSNHFDPDDPDYTGFAPATGYKDLPGRISSNHVFLAEEGRYIYFVDERFTYNSGRSLPIPMNSQQFIGELPTLIPIGETSEFKPVLTLNNKTGYVALIIDAAGGNGELDTNNGDLDRDFYSGSTDDPNADKIVGITYEEWYNAVNRRLCVERFRYGGLEYADGTLNPFTPGIAEGAIHWYNAWSSTNPEGTNLRTMNLLCNYEY